MSVTNNEGNIDIMDNEMEKCITSLFKALSENSKEETNKLFGEAISHAQKSKVKINNPESFDCFINHKLQKGIKLLASTLHEPSVCKDKNKPNFIYANYSFLESHIKALCQLREGSSCCADKSRYIMSVYLKYSITGEIPEFNPNTEEYYKPNFGTSELWIDYCNSLYGLYYGCTKEYFVTYQALIQCEIRKFKHTLHRWFMEFNDGKIIEYDYTWDDKDKNPLDDYADKGDYYIIHKRIIKDDKFEIYEPIDEEEQVLFRKHFVKIPKTEIKQIYKESEERME